MKFNVPGKLVVPRINITVFHVGGHNRYEISNHKLLWRGTLPHRLPNLVRVVVNDGIPVAGVYRDKEWKVRSFTLFVMLNSFPS